MSDIEVDIRTDENVHGVTDPSAAGPATQSRYNRDLISDQISFQNKFSVWGHSGCQDRNKFEKIEFLYLVASALNIKFRKSKMSFFGFKLQGQHRITVLF